MKNKTVKLVILSSICLSILGVLYFSIGTQVRNKSYSDNLSLNTDSKKDDKNNKDSLNEENITSGFLGINTNPNDNGSHIELTKVQLSVPQSVQENNYFCGPASLQMVLRYHGISVSQSQLAKEMNTVPVTGTEYNDLAKVVNKYLFNNSNVGPNDPGYHVQTLQRYDTDPEIAKTFEKRVKQNISTNDPVFLAVDVKALYPNLSSANHLIVLTGYTVYTGTDKIAYYYYLDPSYAVQDDIYGGLKTVTSEELINAIVSNVEPAYIW